MKLIIAGSRDLELRIDDLAMYLERSGFDQSLFGVEVVCGMAVGIDALGHEYAQLFERKLTPFYPEWKTHGKAAGPIRNAQMADYADAALVIMRPGSRGSKNMIEEMLKRGKPIWVFTVM